MVDDFLLRNTSSCYEILTHFSFFLQSMCLPAGVPSPDAGRDRVRGKRVQGGTSTRRGGAHGAGPGTGGVGQRSLPAHRHVHHPAGFCTEAEYLSVRRADRQEGGGGRDSSRQTDRRICVYSQDGHGQIDRQTATSDSQTAYTDRYTVVKDRLDNIHRQTEADKQTRRGTRKTGRQTQRDTQRERFDVFFFLFQQYRLSSFFFPCFFRFFHTLAVCIFCTRYTIRGSYA